MANTLETLAFGYGLIEGPRVDDAGNLYFSDVPNGGVRRLTPDGTVELVIPKRRGVGGIALHAAGGLVVSGRNICHVTDGETTILFETECLGFNDLMADAHGRVICGTIRSDPFDLSGPRQAGEAYRINLDGSVDQLYGGVGLTNGIGFSPDGTRMYHSDSVSGHVICHDIDPAGGAELPTNRRPLKPAGHFSPDGLAVDEDGVVWVADFEAGAVLGLTPEGDLAARIDVPATMVTSLCFGGEDRRDLYIVTADNTEDAERAGTIFRTRADVPGLAAPLARVVPTSSAAG
ncbi:MAG: SMP-30/gluconolactonase/LRE family protein [Actinomycetota bacterium]